MSKELGVGVRVFVGWCPDAKIASEPDMRVYRLRAGVIFNGPIYQGERNAFGRRNATGYVAWDVKIDDDGTDVVAVEHMLTPIDDSDEQLETEREREEVV